MGTRYYLVSGENPTQLLLELNEAAISIEKTAYIVQTHLISGTSAIIEYFIPEEDGADGVGRVVIQGAGHVGVGVGGHADGGVAQPLTDHLQGYAGDKPYRRVPVTQVVNADVGQAGALDVAPPTGVNGGGVQESSGSAGEDELRTRFPWRFEPGGVWHHRGWWDG